MFLFGLASGFMSQNSLYFLFIYKLYCEHHRNSKAKPGGCFGLCVARSNKNKEKAFYAVAIQTLIQNNRWKRLGGRVETRMR